MSDLMFRIQQHYAKLTPSSRRIADYLQSNAEQAQYFSISELALACSVAEATIFRFCRALGFSGYNDFKLALAKSMVGTELSREGQADTSPAVDDGSVQSMSRRLYAGHIEALNASLARVDEAAVVRAVDLLEKAGRVYCFGSGCGMISAMQAQHCFSAVSGKFFTMPDHYSQVMAASLMDPDDVLIYFSLTGSSRSCPELLRPAHSRGGKIILITSCADDEAARYADVFLLCGSGSRPLPGGSLCCATTVLFELDVLVNEFCRRNSDQALNSRKQVKNALRPLYSE